MLALIDTAEPSAAVPLLYRFSNSHNLFRLWKSSAFKGARDAIGDGSYQRNRVRTLSLAIWTHISPLYESFCGAELLMRLLAIAKDTPALFP